MAGFDKPDNNKNEEDSLAQKPIIEEPTPIILSDNNQTTPENLTTNNASSAAIDKILQEQQPNTESTQEPVDTNTHDIEPAIMAGLSANEIGLNASSQAQEQRTQTGQDAQTLRDEQDVVESIFTASPHSNQIAMEQINKGLSHSADGLIAGVAGANITHSGTHEEEEHKKKHSLNHLIFDMDAETAALIHSINENLDNLTKSLTKTEDELNEATMGAEFEVADLDSKILDVEYQLSTFKQELVILEETLANSTTPDEIKSNTLQVDLKNAEIANAESIKNLFKTTQETINESLTIAQKAYGIAKSDLNGLMQQRKELIDSFGQTEGLSDAQKGMLEELDRKISYAGPSVEQAKESLDNVTSNIQFSRVIAEVSTEELNRISLSCGDDEFEQRKLKEINAATNLTNALSSAIEDGKINESEFTNIKELSAIAGLSQEAQNKLATGLSNTNVKIETAEGTLSGDAAKEYMLEQFKQEQIVRLAVATKTVDDALNMGTKTSRAEAKAGVDSIGDNQSLKIDNIKDASGNDVHIDRSDTEPAYYYINEAGEQTPITDPDQVLNFSMGKDGYKPMMSYVNPQSKSLFQDSALTGLTSSSQDTIVNDPIKKKFANEGIDQVAYQARYEQLEAQKVLEQINEIELKAASGEISEEEKTTQLSALQGNSDTQWSSSETLKLDIPDVDPVVADKALNDAKNIVADLKNGATLSQQGYDKLSTSPGMSTDQLDQIMGNNGVTIGENTLANNEPSPQMFNGMVKQPIQIATLATIPPALILSGETKPAEDYQSFADSPAFLANSEPNASYTAPTENRTSNVVSLTTDTFGKEPSTDQPAPSSSGLSPLQIEAQQRLMEEQRLTQANMEAQSSGGGMGQV